MMTTEALYEIVLSPRHTGLAFMVRIWPEICIVEGSMDAGEFASLRAWIELNRETLVAYWEGEIDTQDALEALRKI